MVVATYMLGNACFIRTIIALMAVNFFIVNTSIAVPQAAKVFVDNPKLVGSTRLVIWGMKVYDIALYAPGGVYSNNPPYALEIIFLRDVSKEESAKRVIKEIAKQDFNNNKVLQIWYEKLVRILVDVKPGDTLTIVNLENGETAFFTGPRGLGYIDDLEFGKYFFAIWLGSNSSYPQMRDQLIGISPN